MRQSIFLLCLLLSSCGYRFDGGEKIAVSVPYVIGDHEGELTNALIWALANTSTFRYVDEGGDWILQAKILDTTQERIGYRYDRDPKSGERRDNVIGIENRQQVGVEVKVASRATGKLILGPQVIKGDIAYDYDDPDSLQDLSFINPQTNRRLRGISFSLGQLDGVAAAGEDALYPLYAHLAQQIIDGLYASGSSGWESDCDP